MKKVAILTLPLNNNYGGILQAWALQNSIEEMGYDTYVLDKLYSPEISLIDKIKLFPKRIFLKYICKKNIPVNLELVEYNQYIKQIRHTLPFIKKIKRYQIRNLNQIKEREFDVLCIGSDQIWRPQYFKIFRWGYTEDAFGYFANKWNTRIFSYAASFGIDSIEEFSLTEIEKIKNIIKRFNGVSVRESSAIKICQDYFDVNAISVLDPTMLVERSKYEELADSIPSNPSRIGTYILDNSKDKQNIITHLKSALNTHTENSVRSNQSIEKWISIFRDSELIVTDSFHGTVFSIIFNKKFIVLRNNERGMSRIENILRLLDCQHHLVGSIQEITDINNYKIGTNQLYKLEALKEHSRSFLKFALKGEI